MDLNSKYNIWHVIKGQKDIEDVIMEGPCGLDVICGSSGLEELANITEFHRHRLLDELTSLSKDHDAIIIDTAAGISKSVVGFCLASNHTLVVTTPDATAMADAYATIKVMAGNHYAGRISLIVNMAQSMAEGRKIYQQINKVAKRFLDIDIFNAGIIARDEKVTSALRSRKPAVLAYPRAKFTSSMTALASRISKGTAAQYGNEGFLKKVADWFF
jgi:flagellar biosynthesis protein FlhG